MYHHAEFRKLFERSTNVTLAAHVLDACFEFTSLPRICARTGAQADFVIGTLAAASIYCGKGCVQVRHNDSGGASYFKFDIHARK
jgi:putative hemolysin